MKKTFKKLSVLLLVMIVAIAVFSITCYAAPSPGYAIGQTIGMVLSLPLRLIDAVFYLLFGITIFY